MRCCHRKEKEMKKKNANPQFYRKILLSLFTVPALLIHSTGFTNVMLTQAADISGRVLYVA